LEKLKAIKLSHLRRILEEELQELIKGGQIDNKSITCLGGDEMLNLIFNFVILVVLSLMATSLFLNVTGFHLGWGALFLGTLGLLFYFSSNYLTMRFIEKKAPEIVELDAAYGKPMNDGEYLWEKTAGTGIVPKWVSLIGIASYACFAGVIIWLIVWLKG